MRAARAGDSADLHSNLVTYLHGAGRAREVAAAVIQAFVSHAVRQVTRTRYLLDPAEVQQEAMSALLASPHRFDAARGSASAFLYQVVREAARTVRSTYVTAGNRKRQGSSPPVLSVPVEDLSSADEERFAQAKRSSAVAVEARCDVVMLAPRIPQKLALIFIRLADGEAKTRTAAEFNLDRFKLERLLDRCRQKLGLGG
jgi:hypothetical protein